MLMDNNPADDKPPGKETDTDIVKEANERWHAILEWQGTSDERAREDIKFSHGDSRNAWQWPEKVYQQRTGETVDLPALTINKTRVHNDIIINDMSKHGFGIKIRPTAGGASYQSAQVMQSIIRRIQYISKYSSQRRRVAEHQVDGGIGYTYLETRYVSNKSRNQDIYICAPRDPTGVYLDPYIQEPDGSDAGFGFLFERKPRKEFNRKYPQWAGKVGQSPLASSLTTWLTDKEIVVAKYYRKIQKKDTYIWYRENEFSPDIEKLASEIKEETRGDESKLAIYKALLADIKDGRIEGGTREVFDDDVKWYLIAGDTIIDRGDWPGKYIPICRAVGREVVVDNTLDRKGHTRSMIDPQRMLNYASSCNVEGVAMQVKSKWLAPLRAIENIEAWEDANIKNKVVLPWNDIDDEHPDLPVTPPQAIEPAKPSPGWLQVAMDAERHMMMVSGQYQAQLGEQDNQSAASGKAIGERQEQGDTATYHFVEHMSDMERHLGVQLLDLIPKIYDSRRTLHVIDEDGEKSWILVDPDMKEALRELTDLKQDEEAVKLALNPAVGEYECVSDPGPSWATQREEAFETVGRIVEQNNTLMGVVGDLVFKYGDFPGAEALQERLKKEIKQTKPYLFDEGVDPQVQALTQQLQAMVSQNTDLMTIVAELKLKLRGRDERRDVDAFRAETDRMKALVELLIKILPTPQQRVQIDHELEVMSRDRVFNMIEKANEPNVQDEGSPGPDRASPEEPAPNPVPVNPFQPNLQGGAMAEMPA